MSSENVAARRSVLSLILSLALGLGLVAALLWMAGAARADGPVLYVTPDGVESGACDSWAAPCDLQYALDEAEEGDEIWVAQGLYTPTHPTTPREGTFALQAGVALYGGFEGGETSRDERDWETYLSVLSGDIYGDDVIDGNGVVTDAANIVGTNVYQVVRAVNVTETAQLDGFIITAGYADESRWGGGLYCNSASPTLRNLAFQGNWATSGGGMANAAKSWPTLSHVEFISNTADANGGGLYNYQSSASLSDLTFRFNSARDGGGMNNTQTPHVAISGARFFGNKALAFGGGMLNDEIAAGNATGISMTDVVFVRNSAETAGGGMASRQGVTPTLVNVGFYGNVAVNGGGAGMHNKNNVIATLANVVFVGNSGEKNGGAMHNMGGSHAVLVNVTMVHNEVRNGPAGGMYNQGSFPLISNTIIYSNTASDGGDQIYNTTNCSPTIAFSAIQEAHSPGWDLSLGVDGGGNTGENPGFLSEPVPGTGGWGADDDDYGDLHLDPLSPVRDKGDNDSVPFDVLDVDGDGDTGEQLPYDFDENPRITGGTVDMGAYEYAVVLGITKEVAGAGSGPQDAVELAQGDPLTFTLRFQNNGMYTATGVILTDVLPTSIVDTQVISAGLQITPLAGTRYVWQIGPLPPDASGEVMVTGLLSGCVPADHQVVNTATIWSVDMANPLTTYATATITATNTAPLAVGDAYTVTAGTVLAVAVPGVLANDSDPDCDELRSAVLAPPVSGTLGLDLDGSLVYTPEADFAGVTTFTYQASDGELTGQALVTVTVEEEEDGLYRVYLPMVLKGN